MKLWSDSSRERWLKLWATPVRRKYFESLERVLGPAGLTSLREDRFFLGLAIAIGILAGLCVVLFRVTIQAARLWLLGSSTHPGVPRVILVPAVAGVLIAFLLIRYFPRVRSNGVNHAKGALYIYDGRMSPMTVVARFVGTVLAIGSGFPMGPEEPALQIGAGVASGLGSRLRLSKERLRLVIPVGSAAGLAAVFNAPITAVLFVIEEVVGRWSGGMLGAVVLSAISSVVVERWFLGSEPLFRVPAYHLANLGELIAYVVLGVLAGVASVLFVGFIKTARPRLRRMPQWSQYLQPAVAGLLVGFFAIRYPQVLGAGYEWVDLAMHNRFPWEVLGILAGLKLISTAVSFACGSPAGLWAPVLFSGAMLGALTATVEQHLLPSIAVPVGAYALVGMGALFAGILRAPMTSVFMVLEVSGDYSIILPVLICNAIAYMISRSFHKVPLYELVARQDGLDLPSLEEEQEQPVLCVEDAMRSAPTSPLQGEQTIAMARQTVGEGTEQEFLVSLGQGRWSLLKREALFADGIDEGAVLRSLARSRVPRLYLDQSLDVALRFLKDRPMLPVVDRGSLDHLLGVVSVEEILLAYRRAGLTEPESPDLASA